MHFFEEYSFVHDEIAAVKDACQGRTLKVILETGELCTLDNVRLASDLAILAGADFIKTSTGKVSPAATMPVTLVMLQAIKDHFLATVGKDWYETRRRNIRCQDCDSISSYATRNTWVRLA